ncbi:MAG: molybdopterin-binding protein [Candidatus Helarchaeota archaeon]
MIISVELLFVGNELLNGKIINTNAQFLCEKITNIGAQVRRIITIPDDVDIISDTIKYILKSKPGFLIISGGLGPTFDDMTLKGVVKALGKEFELKLNQDALDMIEKQYKLAEKLNILKNKGLNEHKIKMATIPSNSIPLYNSAGIAPGVHIKYFDNIEIFCLPGVPKEMKSIFNSSIKSIIMNKVSQTGLKFSKTGFIVQDCVESEIAPFVNQIMSEISNVWIKTQPRLKNGKPWVEVFITCLDKQEISKDKVSDAKNRLIKLLESNDKSIKLIDE